MYPGPGGQEPPAGPDRGLDRDETGQVAASTLGARDGTGGDFAAPAADGAGEVSYGPGSPLWSPGPETGAWSFESDGVDEEGVDDGWEHGTPWDASYSGATANAEQDWYEPDAGNWDSQQAVPGPNGWYSEGFYPDEYSAGYARSRRDALAAYEDGYGTSELPQVWDEGDGATPRRAVAPPAGPWPELVMITAVAVIIAAVILAVTSANRNTATSSQSTVSTATSPTVPAAATGAGHKGAPSTVSKLPSTVPKSSAAPSSTAASSTSTVAPVATAIPVTPGVAQSLITSWLHTDPGGVGLAPKDVAGTVPQQVFYGKQDGAPPLYWAVVAFQPSASVLAEQSTAAGQQKLAQFQNSTYVFDWKAGPYWTELGYVATGDCPGSYVPTAVLAAWHLCGL